MGGGRRVGEGLLADDRAGGLVVDVEVSGRVAQHVHRLYNGAAVAALPVAKLRFGHQFSVIFVISHRLLQISATKPRNVTQFLLRFCCFFRGLPHYTIIWLKWAVWTFAEPSLGR